MLRGLEVQGGSQRFSVHRKIRRGPGEAEAKGKKAKVVGRKEWKEKEKKEGIEESKGWRTRLTGTHAGVIHSNTYLLVASNS